jgi:hypothetical protein
MEKQNNEDNILKVLKVFVYVLLIPTILIWCGVGVVQMRFILYSQNLSQEIRIENKRR